MNPKEPSHDRGGDRARPEPEKREPPDQEIPEYDPPAEPASPPLEAPTDTEAYPQGEIRV